MARKCGAMMTASLFCRLLPPHDPQGSLPSFHSANLRRQEVYDALERIESEGATNGSTEVGICVHIIENPPPIRCFQIFNPTDRVLRL